MQARSVQITPERPVLDRVAAHIALHVLVPVPIGIEVPTDDCALSNGYCGEERLPFLLLPLGAGQGRENVDEENILGLRLVDGNGRYVKERMLALNLDIAKANG